MTEPRAIVPRPVYQFVMISAALAEQFRREFDLKAFEFNRSCLHDAGPSPGTLHRRIPRRFFEKPFVNVRLELCWA